MPFDHFVIESLLSEFRHSLTGGKVEEAYLSDRFNLFVKLEGGTGLSVSCSPVFPRIYLSSLPSGYQQRVGWYSKYLAESTVVNIDRVENDRVLRFELVKEDRIGTVAKSLLIVELTGRNSNIILVREENGIIIDAVRRVTSQMSRLREILPGLPYVSPPSLDKIFPVKSSFSDFSKKLLTVPGGNILDSLTGSLSVLSKLGAKEITFRAGIPFEAEVKDLTEDDIERLWEVTLSLYQQFQPDNVEAYLILDEKGRVTDFSVLDLTWLDQNRRSVGNSLNGVIELFYNEKLSLENEEQETKKALDTINKSIATTEKKIIAIETDLNRAEKADEVRIKAELLAANLFRVKKGETETKLQSFYDPEQIVTVELDPELSPAENVQSLFRRYRKAIDSLGVLRNRLQQARTELAGQKAMRERLISGERIEDLQATGQPGTPSYGPGNKAKPTIRGPNPRRYVTSEGWTVLVGRNDTENALLTHKIAAPEDLWFHAQGCPGSHVILRREGRKENPSKKMLEEVGALAAYWSKARGSNVVPVCYTEVRYVSKIRKAKPGLVKIEREKTVFVKPKLIGSDK